MRLARCSAHRGFYHPKLALFHPLAKRMFRPIGTLAFVDCCDILRPTQGFGIEWALGHALGVGKTMKDFAVAA